MKHYLKRAALLGLLLLLLFSFVRVYKITDISMNYTLVEGDYVVVENISAGIHLPSWFFYLDLHLLDNEEGIHRGDLLAFRHPLENRLYLKRCVALPGDKLFLREKNLYLQIGSDSAATCRYAQKYGIKIYLDEDGCWLENPYSRFYAVSHLEEVTGPPELLNLPKRVVPPHSYFFMGDFRDNSTDSRFFGPIEYDKIYYKVWFTIRKSRSLEYMGSIKNF